MVAWQSSRPSSESIAAQRFTLTGRSKGLMCYMIEPRDGIEDWIMTTAGNAAGSYVVSWMEVIGETGTPMFQGFQASGEPATPILHLTTSNPDLWFAVAIDGAHRLAVAWPDATSQASGEPGGIPLLGDVDAF